MLNCIACSQFKPQRHYSSHEKLKSFIWDKTKDYIGNYNVIQSPNLIAHKKNSIH